MQTKHETMASALRETYKACETPREWKLVEGLIVSLMNRYAEEEEENGFRRDDFASIVFS
tara:strand:+ start:106 stop:285 length:180 start_codon:yes stop_codon:yes gene_type:complete